MSKALNWKRFAAVAAAVAVAGQGLLAASPADWSVSSATAQTSKKKPKPEAKPKPQPAAPTNEFKYDDKTNAEIAAKLKMPVFYAVPASARAPLPQKFDTTDKLIEFKHPDSKGAPHEVGLRIIKARRDGFAKRMAKSGLIQTGDILLTFRPEWGGVGPYPNVQMGVSHAGLAFVKDGTLHHLDNPMDRVHMGNGLKGDFTSEHYRTLSYLHVIRPRGLTEVEKSNLVAWATRLQSGASKTYPLQIQFNSDYGSPKYANDSSLEFVKKLGQIALGQGTQGQFGLYCSEFVWSVLAMRKCDPVKADAFAGRSVPSCIDPAMQPMGAIGNAVGGRSRRSEAGLVDGPLLVINSMGLKDEQEVPILKSVFLDNPGAYARMSEGHRNVAKEYAPKYAELERYYLGVSGSGRFRSFMTRSYSKTALWSVPENYSPTSYIVDTLLPADNVNRSMDYVATVMFDPK